MKLSICALLPLLGMVADAGKTSFDIASLAAAKLGVQSGSEAHKELTSPHMSEATGPLLDLLKQGQTGVLGQDSNNSEVVQSITDILDEMKTRLYAAHNRTLVEMEEARFVFIECLNTYKAADLIRFSNTSFLQSVTSYEELFKSYEDCKQWEEELGLNLTSCDYYCLEEAKFVGENCTSVGEDCAVLHCTANTNEDYKTYLQRMVAEITEAITKVDGYTENGTRCEDILEDSKKCYENCEALIKPVIPVENNIPGCCAPRTEAETQKCSVLKDQRDAWSVYSQCYDDAIPNWEAITTESEARAGQMRSILRMECYVDTFSAEDQNHAIELCIQANYTQDPQVTGLYINAGPPPPKADEFQCNASETPGSPEFDAIHYAHLPDGLIACPEVHCEDACGFSNTSLDYYASTTPSPPPVNDSDKVTCFKQLATASAVYWDFGSSQLVDTISANPSPGVQSINVYLTDGGPDSALRAGDVCGTITETERSVSCSSLPGARYLVLKGMLQGSCVYGECVPAWCNMTMQDAAVTQEPDANTGTSYLGVIHDGDHHSGLIPTIIERVTLVGHYTTDIVEEGGKDSFLNECTKRLNPGRCIDVAPLSENIQLEVGAVTESDLDDIMTIISTGHLSLSGFGTFEQAAALLEAGAAATGHANAK